MHCQFGVFSHILLTLCLIAQLFLHLKTGCVVLVKRRKLIKLSAKGHPNLSEDEGGGSFGKIFQWLGSDDKENLPKPGTSKPDSSSSASPKETTAQGKRKLPSDTSNNAKRAKSSDTKKPSKPLKSITQWLFQAKTASDASHSAMDTVD